MAVANASGRNATGSERHSDDRREVQTAEQSGARQACLNAVRAVQRAIQQGKALVLDDETTGGGAVGQGIDDFVMGNGLPALCRLGRHNALKIVP